MSRLGLGREPANWHRKHLILPSLIHSFIPNEAYQRLSAITRSTGGLVARLRRSRFIQIKDLAEDYLKFKYISTLEVLCFWETNWILVCAESFFLAR